MRKIVLYTAVTIDGLIARKDGAVDWLDPYGKDPDGSDYGYADFIGSVDTTIMGNKTYEVTRLLGGTESMSAFSNYVLTRKKGRKAPKHFTFLSGNVLQSIGELKTQKGKDIWLLGGGQVNSLLAGGGLIDEIILTVIPIVLGEGIPLFAQPGAEAAFVLASSRSYRNGLVQSVYRKAGP